MKTFIIVLIWIVAIAGIIVLGMLNDIIKIRILLSILGGN